MIVVTGGAGFIGSQLVSGLNRLGREDIIVVDNLKNGQKFNNLVINKIADFIDKQDFRQLIKNKDYFKNDIDLIFHQGACSVTTEWDGQYMMDNNYTYSKELVHYSLERSIPFIYASSAAVYGVNMSFVEDPKNERPINVYGYSKLLFDNYVRKLKESFDSQIVGLRYFNVYGPCESHKGSMASVAYHLNNQLKDTGVVKLFKGCHGYADGEQVRDFIYVDDVVDVNLWMMDNAKVSGIFNVGTGSANSFNSVANAVIDWHGKGSIEYIPFPEKLLDSYQSFTQANISNLQNAGYDKSFTDVKTGVHAYMKKLNSD